jgi:hypothetical protein
MTLPELQHLLNLMDADNKKIRDAYRGLADKQEQKVHIEQPLFGDE